MEIMPIAIFAVLAGLPVLNALLLRVSAVFLFTSIAVGNFLLLFIADDASLAANTFSRSQNVPMIVQLTLLFLPVVLTLFFLRKSMPRSKFLLHLLPLLGCGLSLAVLALPLLPSGIQAQIFGLPSGDIFKQSQDLIISITGVLVLLLMWHSYKPHEGGKHGKKHH